MPKVWTHRCPYQINESNLSLYRCMAAQAAISAGAVGQGDLFMSVTKQFVSSQRATWNTPVVLRDSLRYPNSASYSTERHFFSIRVITWNGVRLSRGWRSLPVATHAWLTSRATRSECLATQYQGKLYHDFLLPSQACCWYSTSRCFPVQNLVVLSWFWSRFNICVGH